MSEVLVLNKANMPINVYRTWKPAVLKLENKRAEVVATYPGRMLNTWKEGMEAPAIIRLLYFLTAPGKASRKVPYSRKNIWLRDNGRCQYCGKSVSLDEMQLEHVVPRDQGGRSNFLNIVCSCLICNSNKANRTPQQAGMRLRRVPFVPRCGTPKEYEMLLRLRSLKNLPHAAWRRYIYYNIPLDQD
jgi:5-methylcytosine-specific restriction endonuclease McrA